MNHEERRYHSIKKAVVPLHPIGRRSTVVESNKERHRFSHLILEHGEKHIQDWAVVASSGSSDTNSARVSLSTSYDPTRVMGDFHPSNSQYNSSGTPKPVPPSACMGLIEGRLRLCSRSIVFEPLDTSRGIIRCPFHRMEHAPRPDKDANNQNLQHQYIQQQQLQQSTRHSYFKNFPSSSTTTFNPGDNGESDNCAPNHSPGGKISNLQNNAENQGNVVVIKSNRHLTMKANNVIAPFEMISTPVVFRFHFLHSSPDLFFELSQVSLCIIDGFFFHL